MTHMTAIVRTTSQVGLEDPGTADVPSLAILAVTALDPGMRHYCQRPYQCPRRCRPPRLFCEPVCSRRETFARGLRLYDDTSRGFVVYSGAGSP